MSYEEALQSWLDTRKTFVGSSEVFELLEVPQYNKGCKRALAYKKLGATPDTTPTEEDEALFKRGHIMEPIVAALYEEQTGRRLRRPPMDEHGFPKTRRHPEHTWAAVATDRLILTDGVTADAPGDLEIKSRGEGPFYRVLRQGPFPGDVLQVQWSMWVTQHRWGALAVIGVFGALPMVHFDIKADPEIQTVFERQGSEFAEQVWGKNELPEPTFPATDPRCRTCDYRLSCRGEEIDQAEAAVLRAVSRSAKDLVQITNTELAHTLSDMDLLKAEAKSIEASLEVARQKALGELGEVDAAWLHGYGKIYRMPTQANYFDAQRLKADDPTLYDKYMVHRLTGDHFIRTYPQK